MKTYIINLERSPERREHIVREAEKHGLDYELIKAVDGKLLTEDEIERLCDTKPELADERMPRSLSRPIFGCALSHLSVYRKIINDDVDAALVLEDDAVLPDGFSQLLQSIEQNIGKSEVVSLCYWTLPQSDMKLSRLNAANLTGEYKLMYPMKLPLGAGSYVITRDAARTLSKIILPVRVEADHWWYFFDHGGFESFRCVYPMPNYVSFAETTNQSDPNISARNRFKHLVLGSRVPVIYQAAMKLRSLKSKYFSIKLVNEPSPVTSKKG